jgi:hypothetical protein
VGISSAELFREAPANDANQRETQTKVSAITSLRRRPARGSDRNGRSIHSRIFAWIRGRNQRRHAGGSSAIDWRSYSDL